MRPDGSRSRLLLAAVLLAAAACRRESGKAAASEAAEPARAEAAGHEPTLPDTVHLAPAAIAEAGIQTWTVVPVNLEHVLTLNGTVSYDENALVQVASNVRGRVASIAVDLGAKVRRGDPLLWIESVELSHARDAFVRALADLRVAEPAFERAKALLQSKAISLGELQSREGAYISARAEADTAERALRQLGETEADIEQLRRSLDETGASATRAGPHRLAVRAPFGGTVVDRKVTPGALVEALQPLATVANLADVWVFLQAHEKDLSLLREGLPVTIGTEAFPQGQFHGSVDFIGSVVDDATRTIRVRATVDNPQGELRPGMFVRARVEVPKPASEAGAILAVPESALQSLEGRTHVFVETAPGVFARRAVETGHAFDGFTEILAGVRRGDAVVTEGSFVLKSEFAKATLTEED